MKMMTVSGKSVGRIGQGTWFLGDIEMYHADKLPERNNVTNWKTLSNVDFESEKASVSFALPLEQVTIEKITVKRHPKLEQPKPIHLKISFVDFLTGLN